MYGVLTYMESDNQLQNNKPWLWKKGQSGNLRGRPVGKTLKDYAREYLSKMTEQEKDEWMDGLPKEIVWKMAEGNPKEIVDNRNNKIIDDATPEEIEIANKIINERRSDTISPESKGSLPVIMGREIQDQE